MKRIFLAGFFFLIAPSSALFGQLPVCQPHIEGSCDLTPPDSSGQVSSFAQADFYAATCGLGAVYMEGTHKIASDASATISILQWGVQGGSYSGTRQGQTTAGECYTATNNASAYPGGYPSGPYNPPINGGPWTSTTQCAPVSPPPDPPPPPPTPCTPDFTNPADCASPIIFNLGHGGYELTGPNDPVLFDISASGTPRRMGWTAPNADEAFLWLDRNHNGRVDDGSELFGNATPLRSGQRAPNGFEVLAEFDSNGDGVIDAHDPIWNSLLLWFDRNHDGISQPDEIQPITDSSITAIELSYHWSGRRDALGNTFRYESKVWLTRLNGSSGEPTPRPVYDIFFVPVN